MRIYKEFTIEVAHHLPQAPLEHKCRRLHGHSIRIEIHVEGSIDKERGWVIDFGDIKEAFAPVYDALDHRYLNEVEGLENPTSEILCRWIWDRICGRLPGLAMIVVHETCTTGCVYDGSLEAHESAEAHAQRS